MSDTPRTDKARQDALDEFKSSGGKMELGFLTGTRLDALCRELERELADLRKVAKRINSKTESEETK